MLQGNTEQDPVEPKASSASDSSAPGPGSKAGGLVMVGLGVLLGYLFLYLPVQSSVHTHRSVSYSPWSIMLPPIAIYLGFLLLTGEMRDGRFRTVNAQGKSVLSTRGNLHFFGMVALVALTFVAWFAYLRAAGFRP